MKGTLSVLLHQIVTASAFADGGRGKPREDSKFNKFPSPPGVARRNIKSFTCVQYASSRCSVACLPLILRRGLLRAALMTVLVSPLIDSK